MKYEKVEFFNEKTEGKVRNKRRERTIRGPRWHFSKESIIGAFLCPIRGKKGEGLKEAIIHHNGES